MHTVRIKNHFLSATAASLASVRLRERAITNCSIVRAAGASPISRPNSALGSIITLQVEDRHLAVIADALAR